MADLIENKGKLLKGSKRSWEETRLDKQKHRVRRTEHPKGNRLHKPQKQLQKNRDSLSGVEFPEELLQCSYWNVKRIQSWLFILDVTQGPWRNEPRAVFGRMAGSKRWTRRIWQRWPYSWSSKKRVRSLRSWSGRVYLRKSRSNFFFWSSGVTSSTGAFIHSSHSFALGSIDKLKYVRFLVSKEDYECASSQLGYLAKTIESDQDPENFSSNVLTGQQNHKRVTRIINADTDDFLSEIIKENDKNQRILDTIDSQRESVQARSDFLLFNKSVAEKENLYRLEKKSSQGIGENDEFE